MSTEHENGDALGLLATLKQALVNERVAPELLPFAGSLVDQVEDAVRRQEDLITDYEQTPGKELPKLLLQQELIRAKYLLRCYYRTRLHKIEEYNMFILDSEEQQQLLSDKERQYVQQYFLLYGGHMKNTVLGSLPEAFSSLVKQCSAHTEKDMVSGPSLQKHVFCRVLADRGTVDTQEDGSESVDMQAGDMMIIRYKMIRQLLQEGSVELA